MSEARFKAHGTSVLAGRKLFVVHGEILEGTVEPGMVATFQSDGFSRWALDIQGVEFMDWPTARRSEVALTFHYISQEELALLQRQPFAGQEVIISKVQRFPCPCCGFYTLPDEPPGTDEICPVCFWQDDYVQSNDPDYPGGANRVSLREARQRFEAFGVSEERLAEYVRQPRRDEYPPERE
jgi:hypothetical protein